jgi:NADPH:quinone reductase-like Zn-dependent oxidoreductase
VTVEPDQVGLDELVRRVERGSLRVHVDEVFSFGEVARAHARLDRGGVQGKLVLTP